MAIRSFYKRQRLFKQMTHTQGASRGMYLRLMALSSTEIIGTIPLGTYFIVTNAKAGVTPWQGWAYTHSHYSDVPRIAGFVWKNDPSVAHGLEMFRWSLVACAFVFFAYFGFADETRQLYRRMYNSIATRIGCPRFIPHGPSYLYVVHSLRWTIWTHLNSLFFFLVSLQYVGGLSREEQRHRHCGHDEQRVAQIERLIRRAILDRVYFRRR